MKPVVQGLTFERCTFASTESAKRRPFIYNPRFTVLMTAIGLTTVVAIQEWLAVVGWTVALLNALMALEYQKKART